MKPEKAELDALRPDAEVMTRQGVPCFIGISSRTVGSTGLSMRIVVIPAGGRAEPQVHAGHVPPRDAPVAHL